MTRSIDLFIASEGPLEALVEALTEIEGVQVSSEKEGAWTVKDGDVRAVLGAQRNPDSGEQPLRRYRYVLSAEVEESVRPQDSPQAALLRKVAEKLQRDRSLTVLLVLDLQYRANAGQAEVTA